MRSNNRTRRLRVIAGVILAVSMIGCVSTPVPNYEAGVDNTEAILRARLHSLAVDPFDATPGVDRPLGMRGSQLQGGTSGSFAVYLHDAVVTELDTAGRYDPKSPLHLSATLVRNELDAGGAKIGTARIAAHFRLVRDGRVVFDKTLDAENRWESSFMGAIALPAAMDHYSGALQKLVAALVADPEFRAAAVPES